MNDLEQMMRADASHAPPFPDDLDRVLVEGRRRVRRRRHLAVGGVALAVVAVVTTGVAVTAPGKDSVAPASDVMPVPEGPRLSLSGALPALEGAHFRVLASRTNEDLDAGNGTYLRGVTDDGLTLLQDGPRGMDNTVRWGLRPPEGGPTTWLPTGGSEYAIPLSLGADELVLLESGLGTSVAVETYDRRARSWSRVVPSALVGQSLGEVRPGPDGRIYLSVEPDRFAQLQGGSTPDENAYGDESDADGTTRRLFSFDPADPGEVRDESLTVGSFGFGDGTLVWSEKTGGDAGRIHVRDLTTEDERSFDPHTSQRCNLLGFDVSGDRIALSQYCGTYASGARDDRVQVLSTDGDLVGTFQSPGISGSFVEGSDTLLVLGIQGLADSDGTYVQDLADGSSYRISRGASTFMTGPVLTRPGQVTWRVPVNSGRGVKQVVARWID